MKNLFTMLLLAFAMQSLSGQNADPYVSIVNVGCVGLNSNVIVTCSAGNAGNNTILTNTLRVVIGVGINAEITGLYQSSSPIWTVQSLTSGLGNSIVLRNTGGSFTNFDLADIDLVVKGAAVGGPDLILANIVYVTGNNPALGGAPNSSQGNASTMNDNSQSSLDVHPQGATACFTGNITNSTSCSACTGSITPTISGVTPPLSYLWSNGTTGSSATGLCAGTYTFTVTDALGTTNSYSANVGTAVVITETDNSGIPNDGKICVGGTATLTPVGSAVSYLWSSGSTSATRIVSAAGTYSVTVTEASGCTASGFYAVTVSSASVTITETDNSGTPNDGIVYAGNSATMTASGASSYMWSLGSTANSVTVTPSVTTSYAVTGTNAVGCTASASKTITVNPGNADPYISIIASPGCVPAGSSTTLICTVGNAGNGSMTAGSVRVTVTAPSSCSTIGLAPGSDPRWTMTSLTTGNGNTATLVNSAGGFSPFDLGNLILTIAGNIQGGPDLILANIAYLPGGSSAQGNASVSNDNSQAGVLVSAPSPIVTETIQNPTCFGGNDGQISLSITGGTSSYSFLWSNGSTAANATGLSAGQYTVAINGSNACGLTLSYTVQQPSQMGLDVSTTCSDVNSFNGTASATVLGGSAPYIYNWWNGQPTMPIVTGLQSGTYGLTVTDSNGCTVSESVVVSACGVNTNDDAFYTCPDTPLSGSLILNDTIDAALGNTTTGATGESSSPSNGILVINPNGTFIYTPAPNFLGIDSFEYYYCDATGINPCDTALVTINVANVLIAGDDNFTGNMNSPIVGTFATNDLACIGANYGMSSSDVIMPTEGVLAFFPDGAFTFAPAPNFCGTVDFDYQVCSNSTPVVCDTATATIVVSCIPCNHTVSVTPLTPVICNTLGTAEYNLLSGVAMPYSMSLDGVLVSGGNTALTGSLNNLSAGQHVLEIADAMGCTTTHNFVIGNASYFLGATQSIVTNCTSATLSFAPANGQMPYSYSWSDGSTAFSIETFNTGLYQVSITDTHGCAGAYSVFVNTANLGLQLTTSATGACNGLANGSVTVNTPNAGNPPYSYAWSGGITTNAATVNQLPAGTYTVTVTDATGCFNTASVTVAPASFGVVAQTTPACSGLTNGQIDLTVTGGIQPFSYLWSSGQISEDVFFLPPGGYQVQVTDAVGCSATTSATVGNTTASAFITGNTVACPGVSAVLTANSSLGNNAFYTWSFNNVNSQTILVDTPGTYIVTVTTQNNCVATTSVTVVHQSVCPNDPPSAIADNFSFYNTGNTYTNNVLNNDSDPDLGQTLTVSLTPVVSPQNGTLTLLSNGVFHYHPNAGYSGPDNFVYQVCDNGGTPACATATVNLNIQQCQLAIGLTSIASCNTNGSATATLLNGTGVIYHWSNGANTAQINNLTAGVYTITASQNATGCQVVDSVAVAFAGQFAVNIQATIPTCNNDFSVLTASGGIGYVWSNNATSSIITVATPGIYTVTASNGTCIQTATYNFVPFMNVELETDFNCSSNAGTATATVTGAFNPPLSYSWDNGQATATAYGLSSGAHSVTVTDLNGCRRVENFVINTQSFGVNLSFQTAHCQLADGSVSAQITGTPTLPLTYQWSNSATGSSIFNLLPGGYNVTVTDAQGCSASSGAFVSQVNSYSMIVNTAPSSCGGASGQANISLSGNYTAPIAYSWDNGQNSAVANGFTVGSHTVTVTDATGCAIAQTFAIGSLASFQVAVTIGSAICYQSNGTAQAVLTGSPVMPITYNWGSGGSGNSVGSLAAGSYVLTVADGSGCSQIAIFNVPNVMPFNLMVNKTPDNCNAHNGTAVAVLSGSPTTPVVYQWSVAGSGNVPTINNLSSGIYSVTATDANGCHQNLSFLIGGQPSITGAHITKYDSHCGLPNGSAQAHVWGNPYSTLHYTWSGGAGNTQSVGNLLAGNYTVTINDGACSVTASKTVGNVDWVNIYAQKTYSDCNDQNGAIQINLPSYINNPVFAWSNGAGNVNPLTGLSAGWYSVSVTGGNSCYGHSNVQVQKNPNCHVFITGRVLDDTQLQTCLPNGQSGINLRNVRCDGPNGFVDYDYTTNGGQYEFFGNEPGIYTITLLNSWSPFSMPYIPNCFTSLTVNCPNLNYSSSGNNFYMRLDSIQNLVTYLESNGTCRPGESRTYTVTSKNLGGYTMNGTASLTWDQKLGSYTSVGFSTPTSEDLTNRTVTWDFNNLTPGASRNFYVSLAADIAAPMGASVVSTASTLPVATDAFPYNNYFNYHQTITNSYDPNDKSVNIGPEVLPADTVMIYTIRFQNTGTDTAYNVVVKDVLDGNVFDLSTVSPIGSSHPYRLSVVGNNELVFNFENIYLVDSFTNEPASHGYVTFAVRRRTDLSFGTLIQNTASIYFDYNDAVVTNTVISEYVSSVEAGHALPLLPMVVMPNPGNNPIYLLYELPLSGDVTVTLTSIDGRTAPTILDNQFQHAGQQQITMPSLTPGVWIVRLQTAYGTAFRKFVVL